MRKFLATSLLLVLAATLTACPPAAVEKPVISSFTATPSIVKATGTDVELAWVVTGSDGNIITATGTTTIDDPGTASKTTARGVKATTTFTITAKNSAGTATKNVTVTLEALVPAPTITTFQIKTGAGAPGPSVDLPATGGNVTFNWVVTNSTGLSIDNGVPAITPFAPTGIKDFTVPAGTTPITFKLTATGATGSTPATATVTVNRITAALAPVLTSSVPDNAATGVALNNNTIVVNFDKEMNTALTQTAFSGVTATSFVWNAAKTSATITFTAPAAPAPTATGASNTITYNFSNAAKSADGGTLAPVTRTYTTLKLVKATLDPVATALAATTLSGSIVYTNGVDPAPAGQPATCGAAGLPICAANDIDPGEYRIGDSGGTIKNPPITVNPNNAYKGFVGFNLALYAAITPANLVSATFSMNQNVTAPGLSSGTPYALGTSPMQLQSISSAALATIFLGDGNDRFAYYTAPANSSVNFSDATPGLKTVSVKTELTADLTNRATRGNRALFRLMFPKVPAVAGTFDGASDNDGQEDIADFKNAPLSDGPKLEIVYTQP
jgi:hypothetical protein